MEQYIRAEMEVVEFENEDIITASTTSCTFEGYVPDACGEDGHPCYDFGGRG